MFFIWPPPLSEHFAINLQFWSSSPISSNFKILNCIHSWFMSVIKKVHTLLCYKLFHCCHVGSFYSRLYMMGFSHCWSPYRCLQFLTSNSFELLWIISAFAIISHLLEFVLIIKLKARNWHMWHKHKLYTTEFYPCIMLIVYNGKCFLFELPLSVYCAIKCTL